jgi:predicted dehydrogenase
VADLRIGIIGAAKIAPMAVVRPAAQLPGITIAAVAARDPHRATDFAAKHKITTVHPSYDELLADDTIDAVYNPLPNALHAEWTLKALAAGKHVLCEKPFTSNEAEARVVAAAAEKSGLVVMEAFHYRYHALAEQMRTVAHDGRLGEISDVRTWMWFPLPKFSDIRYSYPLGGGATMDCCYAVHVLRLLGPGQPTVTAARPVLRAPDIDRAMEVDYEFPGGATGHSSTSMWSRRLFRFSLRVTGSQGQMRVTNFIAPQYFNRLAVTVQGSTTRKRVRGEASYTAQLRAFAAAVRDGGPVLTPPEDAIVTMRLIDDIYRAAGMPLRGQ